MRKATDITVILDRSGSMAGIKADMEGGFDSFIQKQREAGTDDVSVSLVKFDDRIEMGYQGFNLRDVPRLDLQPRGSTALYDAVGHTIENVGRRLARLSESERPDNVVILIVTDGEENASRHFTASRVSDMIKHQTDKYKWTFVFLGSNQNAITAARDIGISAATSMTFANNSMGVGSAYESLSANMLVARNAVARSDMLNMYAFDYKDQCRQVAAGVDVSQTNLTPEEIAKLEADKLAKTTTP